MYCDFAAFIRNLKRPIIQHGEGEGALFYKLEIYVRPQRVRATKTGAGRGSYGALGSTQSPETKQSHTYKCVKFITSLTSDDIHILKSLIKSFRC